MPFWKKSEDPWDIDPEKRRQPTAAETPEDEQASPGLLEQIKDWNEARKRAQEARVPQPIPCPWCGKEMETRYLRGGRDGVYWQEERPGAIFSGAGAERLDTDGTLLNQYKFAWYCPDCRRLVLDVPAEPAESAGGTFEEHVREYQTRQENGKENDA